MSVVDIIILGFIAIGSIIGLCRGFLKELVGTAGLLVAILVANYVAPKVSPQAMSLVKDETAALALVWILVFFVLMACMSAIAYLLGKAMNAINLGWLNRMAGGFFAGIKFALIAVVLVGICSVISAHESGAVIKPYLEESQLVPHLLRIFDMIWKMF